MSAVLPHILASLSRGETPSFDAALAAAAVPNRDLVEKSGGATSCASVQGTEAKIEPMAEAPKNNGGGQTLTPAQVLRLLELGLDENLSGGVESRHAQRTRSSDVEECLGERPNCKSAGGSSEPADENQTLAGVMSLTAETTRSGSSAPPAQLHLISSTCPRCEGRKYVEDTHGSARNSTKPCPGCSGTGQVQGQFPFLIAKLATRLEGKSKFEIAETLTRHWPK